jgi:hypothetical protein
MGFAPVYIQARGVTEHVVSGSGVMAAVKRLP